MKISKFFEIPKFFDHFDHFCMQVCNLMKLWVALRNHFLCDSLSHFCVNLNITRNYTSFRIFLSRLLNSRHISFAQTWTLTSQKMYIEFGYNGKRERKEENDFESARHAWIDYVVSSDSKWDVRRRSAARSIVTLAESLFGLRTT